MLRRLFSQLLKSRGAPTPDCPDASPAGPESNPLAEYFLDNPGRMIHKWHHYFEIYHRHFAAFRGTSPVVVEIGVFQGGSLQMWRDYFGSGCRIVGIDIDPRCSKFEADDIKILIGDQGDREFLASVRQAVPKIDILIDDGGHKMRQQIAVFEELYPHVAEDGVYLCEDIHTSYWKEFGGRYRNPESYVEYSKGLIDQINAWFSEQPDQLAVTDFTRSTHSLHYYNSILVIEKRRVEPPEHSRRGSRAF